jgi:choline kinase
MKCVILAAGVSSRLYPLTLSTPKCLLKVGEYTILERTIRNVLRHKISQFVIVTGFQAEMITDFVRVAFPSLEVEFIPNPHFQDTNNAYSLALTNQALAGEEMLLLDGDIVFDHRILSELLSASYENCLAVRRSSESDEEEVRVAVDEEWRILQVGKGLNNELTLGESIGIEKFSIEGTRRLFEVLSRRMFEERREDEFYEASFQELVDTGTPICAVDTRHLPCIEIDKLEDLREAREIATRRLDGV